MCLYVWFNSLIFPVTILSLILSASATVGSNIILHFL